MSEPTVSGSPVAASYLVDVAERLVYVSRLVRLSLLGVDGAAVGQIADVVLSAWGGRDAPDVRGFVVALQRRRVFVAAGRMAELGHEGARLRGAINLRQFELRPGELLVAGSCSGARCGANGSSTWPSAPTLSCRSPGRWRPSPSPPRVGSAGAAR